MTGVPRDMHHPLTEQQRAMLEFLGTRHDSYYLNVEAFRLRGPVDVSALRRAVAAVLARHDATRSTFPAGTLAYHVLPMSEVLVDTVFRSARGFSHSGDALAAGLAWIRTPLRLDHEPPVRVWVGEIAGTEALLLVGGHYLVFDAWSLGLFYDDLTAEYARPTAVRPRPPQYHEAAAPRQATDGDAWSDLFGREYAAIRALGRSATAPIGPAVTLRRRWPGLGRPLAGAAKAHRVSPFALGTAALLGAAADAFDAEEVLVGSANAGRTSAASTTAIGFFATTIFFGAGRDDDLVATVSRQLRRWYMTPRTQWEPLLRRYDATDAYHLKFTFLPDDFARPGPVLDGLATERLPVPDVATARRPMNLLAAYDGDGVTAALTYRTDAVDKPTIVVLLDRFAARLADICDPTKTTGNTRRK